MTVDRRNWLVPLLVTAIGVVVLIPVVTLTRQLAHHNPVAYAFDEDAYFSITIARSLATGHGITVDGHHATSGTQALWTLLLTVPFLLHVGTRWALALIGAMSLALWVWAAWSFSDVVSSWIRSPSRETRLVLAFVYLAFFEVQVLSWNGLETGLYLALLLFVARRFVFAETPGRDLEFGLWCAALALARFDAIVLVGALWVGRAVVHRRRSVVPLVLAAVALVPQLGWDWWVAHTLLPQSGIAESGAVYWFGLHHNITAAYTLAPYVVVWPFIPGLRVLTPHRVEALAVVFVIVAVVVVAVRRVARVDRPRAVAAGVFAGGALAICVAYIARSPVFLFYPRYFMPLGLVALGVVGLAVLGFGRWSAAVVLVVTVAAALHAPRTITPGHMGREVLSLARHPEVAGCTRIGMFESGRVGFAYGARIVNLDGKVNEAALKANTHHHSLLAYLDQQHIQLLYIHQESLGFMDIVTPGWQKTWTVVPDRLEPEADFIVRDGATCVTPRWALAL